ncbi:hypothetical protein LA080_012900 [Diaporthe eres]|nr:hypothetical protein LA080_012900 [Diaporthe eres]
MDLVDFDAADPAAFIDVSPITFDQDFLSNNIQPVASSWSGGADPFGISSTAVGLTTAQGVDGHAPSLVSWMSKRAPASASTSGERWNDRDHMSLISSFDKALGDFYEARQKHGRKPWSHRIARLVSYEQQEGRENTRQFLDDRGFRLR